MSYSVLQHWYDWCEERYIKKKRLFVDDNAEDSTEESYPKYKIFIPKCYTLNEQDYRAKIHGESGGSFNVIWANIK